MHKRCLRSLDRNCTGFWRSVSEIKEVFLFPPPSVTLNHLEAVGDEEISCRGNPLRTALSPAGNEGIGSRSLTGGLACERRTDEHVKPKPSSQT